MHTIHGSVENESRPHFPDRPWTAEHEVPEAVARLLVEAQFPQLAPARLESIGVGWDNVAWLVNETWVFRFPRRAFAAPLIETEIRVLPTIAPRLPVAVPVPTFVGRPQGEYPWSFAGHRLIPGRTACRSALGASERARAAPVLGRFLARLHSIPSADARRLRLPPDELRRLDVAWREPHVRSRLDELVRLGVIDDARPALAIIDSAPRDRPTGTLALVHGDLYFRHIVFDGAGAATGVIDWGDVHLGDRACDLALPAGFLPPEALPAFFEAYGPVDGATWRLARFRALFTAIGVLAYAHDIDDQGVLREGHVTLRHLAAGSDAPPAL